MTLKKSPLWKLFSQYIRQRNAKNEIATCFTCGKRAHWKEMDAGHFRHRALTTFFDETNVQVQCTKCNRFLHGNLGVFAIRLDEVYGQRTAKNLIKVSQKTRGALSKKEIKELTESYKKKIANI